MLIVLGLAIVLLAATAAVGLRRATLGLMVLRPACDQAFNVVKFALGQESGPGASLNILILVMAVVGAGFRPWALVAPMVLAWLIFLMVAGLSALQAPDPLTSLRLLLTLATYCAVLILAHVLVRDRKSAVAALVVTLLSSVIPTVVALAELAVTPAILTGEERLLGTFTHSNILAFYLVTIIAVIFFALSTTLIELPLRWRRRLSAYAGVLVLLLLATKTRSAWIALALIFGAQALFVDRRWLWLPLLLPLLLLVPGVGDRFFDLFEGNTNDTYAQLNSLAWRQLLWADTFEWLRQNPPGLLGHGLDHYVSYVPQFFDRGAKPDGIGTHNALLQVYFEAGWLGLLAFLGTFATALACLAGRWRRDPAATPLAMALVIGVVACSYSDNTLDYLQFQWPMWFFVGSVCALARFTSHEPADAPSRGWAAPLRLRLP